VRALLAAALASVAVALPASAAEIEPRALVLAREDVPSGFRLSPGESGLRTNELEAKQYPETRELFKRWRRITGYQAVYGRRNARLLSRADLFRSARGAGKLLARVDLEFRRSGARAGAVRRTRTSLGSGGWLYAAPRLGGYTVVAWRYRRVFATVIGTRLPTSRPVALARAQQRRIAAALG
jgi:hypothetical protein